MLDIKEVRLNRLKIEEGLAKRMITISLSELLEWDQENRRLRHEMETLQSEKNKSSLQIAALKKQGEKTGQLTGELKEIGSKIKSLEKQVAHLEDKIINFLSALPNIPEEDVLVGGKENNEILYYGGIKRSFDYEPKSHLVLCENLNLIDYKRAIKMSKKGFWIYKGLGAKLEWALINYFMKEHEKDGYELLILPHLLNEQSGYVAGQFPKFEDEVYWTKQTNAESNRLFLLPTAETALVNYHRDEILRFESLPRKYYAYTPCYRNEGGSDRLEERGVIRGNQFNKVEMVQYTHKDDSSQAFDEMVAKAEKLVKDLGLHYRINKLAAAECSPAMTKTYDIEVWLPSQNVYHEVSSVSMARDYQSRRGNMRYKDLKGKNHLLHTLNGSGLATSRIIPAIVEQYQQADGSVIVPEVLRPYLGVDRIRPNKNK